jgi:ABC-2 type transport system permease protein
MNAFFALVRKDLILFRSDRRALILNLVVPIVLASFFGYLFGGSGTPRTGRIDVALVRQDDSAVSNRIGAGLKADANLNVTDMVRADAETQVRAGKQKVAIVLPAGFGAAAGQALFRPGDKPVIELLYDPSQSAVLGMVKGMLTQQVMQTVMADMFNGKSGLEFTQRSLADLERQAAAEPDAGAGANVERAALKDFLGSLKTFQTRLPPAPAPAAAAGVADAPPGSRAATGMSVPYATRDLAITSGKSVQGYNGYAHAFAGMGVQFILFMGIDMGIGILLAQRSGVWNRLLAAPVSLTTVLLARAASAAVIAFCLMCILFLFAMLVFRVDVANPAGFLGVAAGYAVLVASFGLLIAAFGRTPEAARGLATLAALVMVMLGGAWVPSFLFPDWIQTVSLAVPTRWAIDGFDAMTWRGLGTGAAVKAMAAELAFALAFTLIAIGRFRAAAR